MFEFKPIGYIESKFDKPADPFEMQKHESLIVIDKKLEEGLFDIESSLFIDVVFVFHQSVGYTLRIVNYYNQDKGVFASRSPKRPTPIGISTVKLLGREGRYLRVVGLDAINGTPVMDIKPAHTRFYKEHFSEIAGARTKQNPRWEITSAIKADNLEYLLVEAGKIHGHYCPGLALGVRAATYAMQKMSAVSDGMEDLVAITETNNCSADGVQFVTGCSFGNNALIFRDLGKTACTLTKRDGKGIRVVTKNGSEEYLQSISPDFYEQFRKVVVEKDHHPEEKAKFRRAGTKAAFDLLNLAFDKIFDVQEVPVKLPAYAPIHESIICEVCGEKTMASRIVEEAGKKQCLSCSTSAYHTLDGHGIKCI